MEEEDIAIDLKTTPEERQKAIDEFNDLLADPPFYSEIAKVESRQNESLMDGNVIDDEDTLPPGTVVLPDFETMRLILSGLGFQEDEIDDLVKHEIDHYLKILEHGLEARILIKVYKDDENGKLGLQPAVLCKIPDHITDKNFIKNALGEIYRSPETMSPDDIDVVDKFGL